MMRRRSFLAWPAAAVSFPSVHVNATAGAVQQVMASLAASSSVDPDAQAWADAVTGAGGTYSAATLAALSAFITSAKANGYWTKFNVFNPLAGNQLTAALIQYKNGSWASATNHNFASGNYTEATGLTGNGSDTYLDTGLDASTLTLNSTHLSHYNRSSSAGVSRQTIGCNDGSGNELRLFAPETDHNVYSDQYNSANGRTNTSLSTPYGFVIATRTATNLHVIYRNGVSISSKATSTSLGVLPALNVFVCAFNFSGTANNFGSHPIACYSVGAGLSPTDAANYNTDLQAFQTTLGRNV